MKKSNTKNELSTQQKESRKFQKIAQDIVAGLLEIATDEYVILSVQQEAETPDGSIFAHVASLCMIEEDGAFYTIDTVGGMNLITVKPFTNLLATKLASKSRKQSKLSAIYFDPDHTAERLIIPADELAFQWEIANGTITPDVDEGLLWGMIATEPGFPFANGEFDPADYFQDNYDYDYEQDSFFEESEEFLDDIVNNASNGHHVITVAYSLEGKDMSLSAFFTKDNGKLTVNPKAFQNTIYKLGILMELELPIGLTMRSFTTKTLDDDFREDSSPQEVRGWSIQGDDIEQLSSDDLITAYCTDYETGKLLSPEPYVKYCDAWGSDTAV